MGATDSSNSDNLNGDGDGGVCECVRACVRVYVRACGRAGVRACGRAGVRACGRAGVRACGRAGVGRVCLLYTIIVFDPC